MKYGIGVGLALLIACASNEDASLSDRAAGKPSNGEDSADGGTNASRGGEDSPNAAGAQGIPVSDGVLIVHAATYNSFRLCFENRPKDLPQPDSTIMPDSNIVGVEVGSIVRIDKLDLVDGKPPGKVYVVREQRIRDLGDTEPKTCGQLILPDNIAKSPLKPEDYLLAGELKEAVGVKTAEVLAITGCGTKNQIKSLDNTLNPDLTRCGGEYNESEGNLVSTVIALQASFDHPSPTEIPIQLYNVAPAIEALGGTVSVAFGSTTEGGGKDLGIKSKFTAGAQTNIDVEQNKTETYGKLGFNVKVDNLAAGPLAFSQTLADVQSLSSPSDTPTTYYYAASNYALLLVGDPSHKATLAGGGTNPIYNPRRALHFLAVPVLDPTKDAGAPAADASVPIADGGVSSGSK